MDCIWQPHETTPNIMNLYMLNHFLGSWKAWHISCSYRPCTKLLCRVWSTSWYRSNLITMVAQITSVLPTASGLSTAVQNQTSWFKIKVQLLMFAASSCCSISFPCTDYNLHFAFTSIQCCKSANPPDTTYLWRPPLKHGSKKISAAKMLLEKPSWWTHGSAWHIAPESSGYTPTLWTCVSL